MTEQSNPPKWRGIFPPLVTPLLGRDTLDAAGLERLIEHVLAGGVQGLFILGTTGEAPSLSTRLRRELIERTCRQVRRRVPVLVGVSDTAFAESVALARHAADAGADGVVLAPPYYFPLAQGELLEYFRRIIAELPLPVFLYNNPTMTKVAIEAETLRQLLDQPRLLGIKDSSGDMACFERLLAVARERAEWSVLIGPEHLLADAIALGGHGGVNGGANLCPRIFVECYEAACRRDAARVTHLQERVARLGRLYEIGRGSAAFIQGLKCALALRGLCADCMAEPFQRFGEPDRRQVRQLLDQIGEW